jgi:Glyoxalase-like domain
MKVEFDHLFILTDIGAPVAQQLIDFGLTEGSSRTHLGQGTANRCFFFHNAMLELLWVYNPAEAQSETIQRTRLWERWAGRDRVCPVGICFRPVDTAPDTVAFVSWDYRPPYLPVTLSIAVANNSEVLTEPMLFQTPFGKRPDQFLPEKAQPLDHSTGLHEITRVEIISPVTTSPSPELQAILESNQIKIRHGSQYCIELGFDGEKQGQQVDFQPKLPLIMCW